jgi:hypothetical protein
LTDIDEATAPFVEAEIKQHQEALIRQMVAIAVNHLRYVDVGGAAPLIIGMTRSLIGWLTVAFESSIAP